jgi:squalene-associated FAD-dependent desaturase
VGGGLAGITAALDCAASGHRVTLLEERGWLGGATFSVEKDGLWLDNGQHVFMRCCTAYRGLLERIGAQGGVTLQGRLDVPVVAPGGRTGHLRRSALPAPLQLAGAIARYPFLSLADKLRLGPAVLGLLRLRLGDPVLDSETFGAWLARHGQRDGALAGLWDLITLPTVNLPSAEASLALGAFVFKVGLLQEGDAADIGWATVPLRQLHHDRAGEALAAAGVEVRLRAQAASIEAGADGVTIRAPTGAIEADAVVVAVPHLDVGRLVGSHLPDRIEPAALGTAGIVNLHVGYDRTVMPFPFAAGIRSPVQFVFDRTASAGQRDGQLLAVSLSGADDLASSTVDELRATFVPALAELFPAARGANVTSFFVTREPAATFRGAPGSARHRPGPTTGHPRIFLAGAWTDTGWPATMEGAVRSGTAAARAVSETVAGGHRRMAA